jgi:hypothetical protein
MRKRPFGVTILAVLVGLLAVLSGIHALQALGIFPYVIGPFRVHDFSFWSFFMWGLLVWVYVWVVQMLWRLDKDAWFFLAAITIFNLILDFTVMLGDTSWSDVSLHFLINAFILIYIMLPGVRAAFEVN